MGTGIDWEEHKRFCRVIKKYIYIERQYTLHGFILLFELLKLYTLDLVHVSVRRLTSIKKNHQ